MAVPAFGRNPRLRRNGQFCGFEASVQRTPKHSAPSSCLSATTDKQPDLSLQLSHGSIDKGRYWLPTRMGMVMAQNRQPATARLTMRRNEHGGIDLETRARVGGNVCCGPNLDHLRKGSSTPQCCTLTPEKKAATLQRIFFLRIGANRIEEQS